MCASIITDGWRDVVAERAGDYVAESTFKRLLRNRPRRRCRVLADIAKGILTGKTKLHDLVGGLGEQLMRLLGGGSPERRFAHELASRIPLPGDAKLTAAARGVQISGILLCVLNDDDLSRCQCFVDLALEQAKSTVKQVLISALDDWSVLAAFPSKALTSNPRS
jgi:hypothetical protein